MGRTQAERDAHGKLADDIYANQLRAKVETEENIGKIITIDTKTGDYEIDEDLLTAVDRLRARRPNADMSSKRIGYNTVEAIGGMIHRTRWSGTNEGCEWTHKKYSSGLTRK